MIIISLLLSVIFLVACNGEKTSSKPKGKNKVIEASIEDARFIVTSNTDSFDPEGNTGLIMINLNVKNKTKNSLDIFPEQNIVLFDDDIQIDAISVHDMSLDLDFLMNSSVGAEKQKIFPVAFEVERDKTYQIQIEPMTLDMDAEAVTLDIDMNDYSETYDGLNEPAEVLQSFIETVYFAKEQEGLEELVNIDIEEQIEEAKKGYVKFLEDISFTDVPSKVAKNFYDDFINALNDKAEVDVKLKGNSGDKAVVEINYEMFSSLDLSDSFRDHRQKFLDQSKTFDVDGADEHAFSKLDIIFKEAKTRENSYPVEIYMSKQDGKWTLESKFSDPLKDLRDIFAEGRNY